MEQIAIIGIGCRFPGATHPHAFWELMVNGVDAISEVPADRFDVRSFYDPTPATRGKVMSRYGGFLDQIDMFDAGFFGISPREAARIDPQHRVLLEVAWEAIEDAGLVAEKLQNTPAGVFIGIITNDYWDRQFHNPADLDVYSTAGSARSGAAGRISYALGLGGVSVAVDAACSSSLVAVHLACQSLRAGSCNIAIAGGVNMILNPDHTIGFSQGKMMAPDGRCKAFDARADGYVRSEGAGVIVLKPLAQALADRDPIYAVIRGTAANNDGKCDLFMMPSVDGQQAVLRQAYADAGIAPSTVQYVEAHGTGTSAGDPVELRALGGVLGQGRPTDQPLYVGSVKTNIGHTEGAAGLAGIIKVALSLKHGLIPGNLHFHTPSPRIPWADLPLRVPTSLQPWPHPDQPRIAGVSSFGIAGTNAHVVLAEAPPREEIAATAAMPHLLTLSAHSADALKDLAHAYGQLLADASDDELALRDIAYSASVRRSHHDHRLALVADSVADAQTGITAFLAGGIKPGLVAGRVAPHRTPRLAMVFPGQGAQWLGMGRELLQHEPVFRSAIEECDQAIKPYVDWSLLEQLNADEAGSRLTEIDVIQPSIWAIQVSLAALWRSWGIDPDAVVGHSMGEVAAAYVAGALSLEDAARIICCRSQLLRRVSGQGAMLVVELTLDQARASIAGYKDRVSIAVSNSPTSTVLSGDQQALSAILETLEGSGTFCRWVKVDVASHSPQMDPLRDDLLALLADVQPRAAAIPIYSTVLGAPVDGSGFDAAYWVNNLREPVLFGNAVQQLARDGIDAFVEVSPHPLLVSAVQQTLQHGGHSGAVLPSLRRDEERSVLLAALGQLYTQGCAIDWPRLFPQGGNHTPLPRFPWQRERYWNSTLESYANRSTRRASDRRGVDEHPVLSHMVQSALHPGTFLWEAPVGTRLLPYMSDHRVNEMVILPAAAYIDLALGAASEAFGAGRFTIEELALKKTLFFPEDTTQRVQVAITCGEPGRATLQVFSYQAGAADQPPSWILHAEATIRHYAAALPAVTARHIAPTTIRPQFSEQIDAQEHYAGIGDRGIQHGPLFQGVTHIWKRSGEVLAQLSLPPDVAEDLPGYQVHPALLDACLQGIIPFLPPNGDTYVPIAVGSIRLFSRPQADIKLWSHVYVQPQMNRDPNTLEGDVFLIDDNGQVLLEVLGFRLQRLGSEGESRNERRLRDLLYRIGWERMERSAAGTRRKRWLIFADRQGVGQQLAAQFEQQGAHSTIVMPGEGYRHTAPNQYMLDPDDPTAFDRLLTDTHACDGIVYLWGLDATRGQAQSLASLRADQSSVTIGVLHLIQALNNTGWNQAPRVWLVTRGAQAVVAGDQVDGLVQSTVWGLGRVAVYEHGALHCTLVDLDPKQANAQSLAAEISSDDPADEVALRGNERYVARLQRYTPETLPATTPALSFRADASYLITGGLGGIGLKVAQWMVEQGARHLVLLGRSGASAAAEGALEAMRAAGATIMVARADVAQTAQLQRVLQDVARTMPPLRGVIHSAVVLDDGILLQQDRERFLSVLPPKLDGAWNLHTLTRDLRLDFFVMFSSGASLIGSPGQGNYAAANAFLDALAHHRRAQGLPALTINWGRWAEVGQATIGNRGDRLDARGFAAMTPQQGLAALQRLLQGSAPQVGVMMFNLSQWRQFFPALSQSSLFADLEREQVADQAQDMPQAEHGLRDQRRVGGPGSDPQKLQSYLAEQVAAVLGLRTAKLDADQPINRLGLDSLMAVELKNRIAMDLDVTIPVATFLQGVTIAQLTAQVQQQLAPAAAGGI
jgi:acyl transferase domain-containing protein/acyl carrier protein